MKTFLIAAGLLMTGASVYGVVDYNKKLKDKEFKELYKEKPAPVETDVVVNEVSITVPVVEKNEVKKEITVATGVTPVKNAVIKKKVVKKKKEERVFRIREFSRGRLG